jgi:hypothetical protein
MRFAARYGLPAAGQEREHADNELVRTMEQLRLAAGFSDPATDAQSTIYKRATDF